MDNKITLFIFYHFLDSKPRFWESDQPMLFVLQSYTFGKKNHEEKTKW